MRTDEFAISYAHTYLTTQPWVRFERDYRIGIHATPSPTPLEDKYFPMLALDTRVPSMNLST